MSGQSTPNLRVGIAGLGSIGLSVARALDGGIAGLSLVAVVEPNREAAGQKVSGLRSRPRVCTANELAELVDVIVEAVPAAAVPTVVGPGIEAGRLVIACSSAALLTNPALIERAHRTGARIIVPSGAILGLDALRAAAEGRIDAVTLETRKPPGGLAGAPHLRAKAIDLVGLAEPRLVFDGNALEAALGFPANVNVAASLALAGIGAERTRVRIWADPTIERNLHTITVEADSARFQMSVEGLPSPSNPKTSQMTAYSVISCLRRLTSTLTVGS